MYGSALYSTRDMPIGRQPARLILGLVVGGLIAISCAADGPPVTVSASPSQPEKQLELPTPEFTRHCGTSIHQASPNDRNWSSEDLVVGPVALLKANVHGPRIDPDELQLDEEGHVGAVKFALGVAAEVDGYAFVSIAPEQADVARLSYDPLGCRRARFAEYELVVAFEACVGSDAYFNGGILVIGPRCVRIEVRANGAFWSGEVPIGVPGCAGT